MLAVAPAKEVIDGAEVAHALHALVNAIVASEYFPAEQGAHVDAAAYWPATQATEHASIEVDAAKEVWA